MSQCAKCSVEVSNVRECAVCMDCKLIFHPTCTRIGTVDNFKKFGKTRRDTWKCDECRIETDSNASRVSDAEGLDRSSVASILKCIECMKSEIAKQISGVDVNVSNVKEQLTAVNETVASLKQTLEAVRADQDLLKQKCEELTQENAELKNQVSELRGEVSDIQQYSRRDNVEIVGVPYDSRENLHMLLVKIAKFYDLPFESADVSTVHRLPDNRKTGLPNIVVKFVRRQMKEEWTLAARRSSRPLTAADLSSSWPSHKIYVNDHLTFSNKRLLGQLRGMWREKKLARVWTRDCRLLVKVAEDSPTRQVRTPEDIAQLTRK